MVRGFIVSYLFQHRQDLAAKCQQLPRLPYRHIDQRSQKDNPAASNKVCGRRVLLAIIIQVFYQARGENAWYKTALIICLQLTETYTLPADGTDGSLLEVSVCWTFHISQALLNIKFRCAAVLGLRHIVVFERRCWSQRFEWEPSRYWVGRRDVISLGTRVPSESNQY